MNNIRTAYILTLVSIVLIFQTACTASLNAPENPQHNITNHYVNKSYIDELELKVEDYKKKVDSLIALNDFNDNKHYHSMSLLDNRIETLKNDIKNNYDSLYKELITELHLVENNINTLGKSYNEIAQIKSLENILEIPPINNEEYREKYIHALEAYQNADWDTSLEGFKYLLLLNKKHDLSDNCQYWIGEVFYKKKQYHSSINEFNIVINNYPNSSKIDDAMYQIGNCFINLGNIEAADSILTELITNYRHSEYVKKATYLIEK